MVFEVALLISVYIIRAAFVFFQGKKQPEKKSACGVVHHISGKYAGTERSFDLYNGKNEQNRLDFQVSVGVIV